MENKITIICLLIFFMATPIFAQAKVGTTGAQFLELSPSVKANGMGETGVSHVHAKSFYFNPGSLGLFALENKIAISGFPKNAKYLGGINYFNRSLSVPLQKADKENSKFLFAIGGYYSVTKLGPFQEYAPGPTGRYYSPTLKNYNATFSVGFNGRMQIGIGGTVKIIKENVFESSQNETAFDIGVIARYPIVPDMLEYENKMYLIPAFGFSVSNIAMSTEYVTDESTLVLPKRKSLGVSIKTGLLNKKYFDRHREIFSVLPSFEFIKINENDWEKQYGVEIGLMEILYYRTGSVAGGGNTNGFSFNSCRLFNLLLDGSSTKDNRSGITRLLTDIISIEYSFANSVIKKSYHEIIVSYQF